MYVCRYVRITLIRIAHQRLLPLRTAFGLHAGFSEAAEGRRDLPSRDPSRTPNISCRSFATPWGVIAPGRSRLWRRFRKRGTRNTAR